MLIINMFKIMCLAKDKWVEIITLTIMFKDRIRMKALIRTLTSTRISRIVIKIIIKMDFIKTTIKNELYIFNFHLFKKKKKKKTYQN